MLAPEPTPAWVLGVGCQAALTQPYSAGNATELIYCYILCLLRGNLAAESKKELTVVFCNSWGVEGEVERGELESIRAA